MKECDGFYAGYFQSLLSRAGDVSSNSYHQDDGYLKLTIKDD
ncbi:hypothetical protein ALO91_103213 [Pseudomonas syringae pv. aceris]|uniref:Uncharacterized protein n=1 Tax=Pseudomonas syringae pv. aceris TaxID=199198 RepID=A0A0L8IT80_PSESX|nr:hypothetical protein PSYAR_00812 [Pseudomonas syringae pv. aceris str. M302273]KOG04626.1 Uncharacterized protein ABJ98_4066 [Pseudomonas syringae pv. aceris]KPW12569.1 hypothetical protein ALO91_103213 [Pseudomonas syringae pv. aceris]